MDGDSKIIITIVIIGLHIIAAVGNIRILVLVKRGKGD